MTARRRLIEVNQAFPSIFFCDEIRKHGTTDMIIAYNIIDSPSKNDLYHWVATPTPSFEVQLLPIRFQNVHVILTWLCWLADLRPAGPLVLMRFLWTLYDEIAKRDGSTWGGAASLRFWWISLLCIWGRIGMVELRSQALLGVATHTTVWVGGPSAARPRHISQQSIIVNYYDT